MDNLGAIMPTQKDPSGRRFVAVHTEVPGTPEEVWQAIATGPGLTARFVPTDLEEKAKGAMAMDSGRAMESNAELQEQMPARRFLAENNHGTGPASPPLAADCSI